MTNEQNAIICRRLAGYEVQVSPAGKHYIVTDEGTREMPDFEVDSAETLSTVEALCKSRGLMPSLGHGLTYHASMGKADAWAKTITAAFAHCLLQIAEGEE